MAAATAMLAGTALFWTVAAPAGADGDDDSKAVLVKRVRLVDEGRTKLVEWVDERTGDVEYCAAVDPRSKVTVTEDGEDGEHELSIEPHDPGADAAVKRMSRNITPEVMRSRTTACLEDDEE